ncbi:MAG: serine acetyltransferase [Shinella sp.]|nr:MAG: serine acetyltransferase [Shinella sp.]
MTVNENPWQKIKADIQAYARADRVPVNAKLVIRLFLLTPGFQFVLARRIGEIMASIPLIGRPLRRVWWWLTCLVFGSEIAIGATVGGGFYIPHPYGIVVGVSTVGRNVSMLQNATIGRRGANDAADPVIGDDVYIGAGAVILGAITLGKGAMIGANSVLLADLPEGATAVGIPAKIRLPAPPAETPTE